MKNTLFTTMLSENVLVKTNPTPPPPKKKGPELANGKCVLSSIRATSGQTFLYELNLVDVSYTTELVSSDSDLFHSLEIYLNWKNNSLKTCRNHLNNSSPRKNENY